MGSGEYLKVKKTLVKLVVSGQRRRVLTRLLACFFLAGALLACGRLHPPGGEAASEEYQLRLARGWEYLNKRHHSRALGEFSGAARLQPGQAGPVHGRARALFYMDRFAEMLAACSEISGESPEYFNALGFCWGARLEISGADPAISTEIRTEIEIFLKDASPSLELLYSAYQGYYYLQDRDKRLALLLLLAEKGADSSLAGSIAAALFREIIAAESGSALQMSLAETYIRSFPRERMAAGGAAIVLRGLLEKQDGNPDYWQIAQTILPGGQISPVLNGAVALWLIEHQRGYEQAFRLLQTNLQGLDERRAAVPAPFSKILWGQEIEKERSFYNYLLGRAWLGQGESEKAREILAGVITQQADWAGPYHFLGMIALGEGRIEPAIEYLRMALARGSLQPETGTVLRELLAEHYGFTGEPLAYFQGREEGPRFRDVTEKSGLAGVRAERVAWGDYDNDGDDDLLLDGSRLFNNQGRGGFVAVPAEVIPENMAGANGGVWGDYDNDYLPDIFVTSHHGNYLLHNEGGVSFSLAGAWPDAGGRAASTEAAAWGDLNNDGLLDLYVANYEQGAVLRGQCGQDQLLVNRGGGAFQEAGAAAGLVSEEGMCGRGVTWSDLNGDGWQDILVANYRLDPNFLWLNQGDGSLVEVAESAGVQGHEVDGAYGHSIGSVSGDLDNDGDLDIFTSNLAHPRYLGFSDKSMVLINNGDRVPEFADRFAESGISFDETSADPLLFDVDGDGDLDLFVTSIYRQRAAHLYINDGKGEFRDQTWPAGAGVINGWGAASADYDGDGYPDLLVASREGVRLLHNEGGGNNWLAIRIDDQNCNRRGVGSKVTINYGRQSQVREITAGRGTGSQDSLTVLFGLGRYDGPVAIQVKTLCGDTLQRQIKDINRMVVIGNKPKKG